MWQVTLLLLHLGAVYGQRWVLFGGYTDFEGQPGGGATAEVELLRLRQASKYEEKSEWCHRNLSVAPLALDGATVSEVSTFQYVQAVLAGGDKDHFTSSHHSAQLHRLLVCGGADEAYKIQVRHGPSSPFPGCLLLVAA